MALLINAASATPLRGSKLIAQSFPTAHAQFSFLIGHGLAPPTLRDQYCACAKLEVYLQSLLPLLAALHSLGYTSPSPSLSLPVSLFFSFFWYVCVPDLFVLFIICL